MSFLIELFNGNTVAHAVLILSLIVAVGLAAGSIRIFGVRLGIAGVLFAGLVFGHYGFSISPPVLDFTRDLGLILFVYTIGLQVGPGFFASFRRNGVVLNLMAAFIVTAGAALAVLFYKFGHVPLSAAVGLFSGATTNAPSLGAAQQALKEIPSVTSGMMKMPGLAFGVAYPFGIIGIILTMIATRAVFRVNAKKEAVQAAALTETAAARDRLDLKV